MRHAVRIVLALAFASAMTGVGTPAVAGGSWFDTDRPRYEPGDEVTAVGYTSGGAYGWVHDGPFFAWLTSRSNFEGDQGAPSGPDLVHYLGPLDLHENTEGHPRLRLSITFTLPDDLDDGVYGFNYCNADCTEQVGDLIGGAIFVGADTAGGQAPRLAGWDPVLTGEPFPDHVTPVGAAPDPDFVPPTPEGIWWTGHVESTEPATSSSTTSTTLPPTTLPPTTLPPTTLPDTVAGSAGSGGGRTIGVALGGIAVAAATILAMRRTGRFATT